MTMGETIKEVKMKKFVIVLIVLIISLGFIGCGNGTTSNKSGSGTDWNGDYYPNMNDIHKTTVNLSAKTITGGYVAPTYAL